jgi:hypothetical protein
MRELEISGQTYSSWSRRIREFMAYQIISGLVGGDGPQVGGPGVRVEIDETLIQRGKPRSHPFQVARRSRKRHQLWLWGAVAGDRGYEHGEVAFVALDSLDHPRGRDALQAALLATVRPGSIVIHDDWGAYRALQWSALPFQHGPRNTVNHSKEIKNVFGEHTNHIEAVWSALKRWLRRRGGGRIVTDQMDLSALTWEFVWRRRAQHGAAIGTFFAAMTTCILQSVEIARRPIVVESPLTAAAAAVSRGAPSPEPSRCDSSDDDARTATTHVLSFWETDSEVSGSPRSAPRALAPVGAPPDGASGSAAAGVDDVPLTATTDVMSASSDEAIAPDAKRFRGSGHGADAGALPLALADDLAPGADAATDDGAAGSECRLLRGADRTGRARYMRRGVELQRFGTTDGCAACNAARLGASGAGVRHSVACRARLERELAREGGM